MNDIAGVWKLRSYSRRYLDTGEVRNDMLARAYFLYKPGGYVMSLTLEADRKPPAGSVLTDQECIRLFRSIMSSYIGTYTVEGNRVTHAVELSWNQSWTGGRLMRYFSAVGATLPRATPHRTRG